LGVWLGVARGQAITPGDSPGVGLFLKVPTPYVRNNDLWLNSAPKPLSLTMNDPYLFPKCT